MHDYEKLGLLYLGRPLDEAGVPLDAPLLYDARDLVTHARRSTGSRPSPSTRRATSGTRDRGGLFSLLFERAWHEGRALTLAELVREVQAPPIERVGVLDLETFFPGRERGALALRLNNLLASPGFQAWMQGEALDVQRLLWTPAGKPRIAILSVAHLSDAERTFFVTLALEELVAWMRTQSGTTSLRALFYMDEIFGYFPPSANPPTKTPLLTLLKQGRAFGLGCVLATQNPVDSTTRASPTAARGSSGACRPSATSCASWTPRSSACSLSPKPSACSRSRSSRASPTRSSSAWRWCGCRGEGMSPGARSSRATSDALGTHPVRRHSTRIGGQ